MTSSTDQPDRDDTPEESPRGAYAAGIADEGTTEMDEGTEMPATDAAAPVETAAPADPAPAAAAPAPQFTSSYVPPVDDSSGGDGPMAAVSAKTDEHPEYLVGGAFAGGVLLALILKSLGRN